MLTREPTEHDLHKRIQILENENAKLKETIDGLLFAYSYRSTRGSYKLAIRIIQNLELFLYRIKKIIGPELVKKLQSKPEIVHSFSAQPINKIAVFIHAFYTELLPEIFDYLDNIDRPFDLYINVPEGGDADSIQLPQNLKKLYRLKNIGKDVGSFIHFMKDTHPLNYDLVLKLHTKKSVRLKDNSGDVWRKCLLNSLIGSSERVNQIIQDFQTSPVGIAGTEELYLPYNIRLENFEQFTNILRLLNVKNKNFGYHAGTMFWYRPQALQKIAQHPLLSFKSFETSKNKDDGDLEHAFERIFALCAKSEGYKVQNYSIALR